MKSPGNGKGPEKAIKEAGTMRSNKRATHLLLEVLQID
jgi:hypothetical protein